MTASSSRPSPGRGAGDGSIADQIVEVRPVAVGRGTRLPVVAVGAAAILLIGAAIAGRVVAPQAGRPARAGASSSAAAVRPIPPAAAVPAAASPEAAPLTSASVVTPVLVTTRQPPFRVETASGATTYVNPSLGFAVTLLIDVPVAGSWDESGSPADAGGVLTFDVPAESAAIGNGAIRVVVGSARSPAPIRVPSDTGPITPLWAPNLVSLVQAYALLLDGGFGRQEKALLDGEPAHLFEAPRGAAAVLLAVHAGRVYVLSSLSPLPTRGASRRAFATFIADFRFLSADLGRP